MWPLGLVEVRLIVWVVAALALSGVGFYPMNNLPPHITAAMLYFRSGLVTVTLFGLAVLFQPRERAVLDRRVNLASLLAAASYAAFILYSSLMPMPEGTEALDPGFRSGRPSIWPLAARMPSAIGRSKRPAVCAISSRART